jgi:hypothetical protein
MRSFYNLNRSPEIIRVIKSIRIRSTEHVPRMGDRRNNTGVFVERPEGNSLLRRPRCRQADNIKMDLQEVGCTSTDLIDLDQDRYVLWPLFNAVLNFRVPQNVGKFLTN